MPDPASLDRKLPLPQPNCLQASSCRGSLIYSVSIRPLSVKATLPFPDLKTMANDRYFEGGSCAYSR